ncbi:MULTISPECIES: acyl-CoA dehydrogenase [Nitrospirillum]|uniref:3-methylmercaptopropionyl-CoA dehydrogenase n=1 Tax=Nitrospirillum amazonense TaxID=28077 RepID=A0A560FVW1_9PROT|nr:acyl-CoA dehydrogenase [Nitrospirillum amazonense]MEC4594320.1 acyl-CoA dehydrogenase [Nitrospirillum amazonense]TWB25777.1 alkylation response protein AidB-like acyl-CoA dehydrogenase [Nitrospirillum amazonense]
MTYQAPLKEIRFVLNSVVGLDKVAAYPAFEAATPDLVDAVLEEGAKLADNVLAPLNVVGDRQGAKLTDTGVRTPDGFKDAYHQFVEGGWNSVPFDPDHGGQGLPWTLFIALLETWTSANMSFALGPLLTQGAVELLTAHGSDEQKTLYLEKLISGEWAGTMNLTEPQAGSDVGAVRTRAVRQDDGTYRISGQKIFITYGDHDWTDNIVHLVLARTPDAPSGTKGISLFIVPKFLLNADGTPGERNDAYCVSLEHKLGIHASPTAVMSYGDKGACVGYLVGEENRGIEYMFTMMNNARLGVGLQGVSIGDRAYQQALAYAKTRVQSRDVAGGPQPVTIIHHPDVRRMLLTMRSKVEAARAIVYFTASSLDGRHHHPDADAAQQAGLLNDLMTPVAKAWSTDIGVEVASLGVQVHGGMGFIEETGAAQYYRDARIAPIYEGTNGIQANDLVFRKLGRDGGATARALFALMAETADAAAAQPGDDLAAIAQGLKRGIAALEDATSFLVDHVKADARAAAAGAVPYLTLFGNVTGAFLLARGAIAANQALAQGHDTAFHESKLVTARFFVEQVVAPSLGLAELIRTGHRTLMALSEDQF